MQCKQCNRQTYISYTCPCCKEYYCTEHAKPSTHNCEAYNGGDQSSASPYVGLEQQASARRALEKPKMPPVTIEGIKRKLFVATLTLLFAEETLRLVSYSRNSPSLELNMYVTVASMWFPPYIASSIIFFSAFLIILATRKTLDTRGASNQRANLIQKAIPIGIYATIAIINITSIAGWIFVLLI